jgi:hypothetical protein
MLSDLIMICARFEFNNFRGLLGVSPGKKSRALSIAGRCVTQDVALKVLAEHDIFRQLVSLPLPGSFALIDLPKYWFRGYIITQTKLNK